MKGASQKVALGRTLHKVVVFAPGGEKIQVLGPRGKEEGQFNIPLEAAVAPDGSLLVLDSGNFRVQVFDRNGKFLKSFGSVGRHEARAGDARRAAQDMIESLNGSALYVGERAFQLKSAMGLIDIDRNMTPKDAIAAASRACRDARKQHQDVVLYEENARELFDHIDELHLFEQLESTGTSEDIFLEMTGHSDGELAAGRAAAAGARVTAEEVA